MRRRIAACVAVLAVASAGACTESAAHTEGKAATSAPARTIGPSACGNGTYQWFNVERPIRLSALSDVQTLGKGGGKFTKAPKHRVSWPETSVSAHGPAVPRRDVLFSLAKLVGEAQEDDTGADMVFTDVGRKPGDPNRSRAISTTGAGRYVMYDEAHIVEADFRYTCPHSMAVTIGHAKSWTMEGSGILECGTPIDFGSKPIRPSPEWLPAFHAARSRAPPRPRRFRAVTDLNPWSRWRSTGTGTAFRARSGHCGRAGGSGLRCAPPGGPEWLKRGHEALEIGPCPERGA